MKGYAGGRLFDAKTSPFGVVLKPIQCLHYALTRPAEIDIAMVNKLYDLAIMHEEVPATVRAHYQQLHVNADACLECGGSGLRMSAQAELS